MQLYTVYQTNLESILITSLDENGNYEARMEGHFILLINAN